MVINLWTSPLLILMHNSLSIFLRGLHIYLWTLMNSNFSQKRELFGEKIQAESDSKAATALNNCLDVIVIQQVGAESPKE